MYLKRSHCVCREEEASSLLHQVPAAGSSHKLYTMLRLLQTQTELKHFCLLKSATQSGAGDRSAQRTQGIWTRRKIKMLSTTHPSPKGNEEAQLFTNTLVIVM